MRRYMEGEGKMAKKDILSALFVSCILILPAGAHSIVGMRGAAWGDLRYEVPEELSSNLVLQGWVKQGIDWVQWRNSTLNTYLAIRYRLDTEGYDWNNSIGPAVGISLDLYTSKGLSGMAGVEYIWDRYTESDRSDNKLAIYLGWYGWWDLKRR